MAGGGVRVGCGGCLRRCGGSGPGSGCGRLLNVPEFDSVEPIPTRLIVVRPTRLPITRPAILVRVLRDTSVEKIGFLQIFSS